MAQLFATRHLYQNLARLTSGHIHVKHKKKFGLIYADFKK